MVNKYVQRFVATAALAAMLTGSAMMQVGCAARVAVTHQAVGENAALHEPVYRHAAVAADHPVASQAGLEILRQGGNAVDAAVATSFCLSVVRPYSCGIGGGGFMVIVMPARDGKAARTVAINYRETAPAAIGPEYFASLDDSTTSRVGPHAVGVPGTVAGLCHALERYGRLSLPEVLAPAIRAAETGFPVDANFIKAVNEFQDALSRKPQLRTLADPLLQQFTAERPLQPGDIVKNPRQAEALRLIAAHGPQAFYQGEIAQAVVSTINSLGGPMTLDDLRSFNVVETAPLTGEFQGYQIVAMPLPSSGGVAMQQVFGILESHANVLRRTQHNDPSYIHLVTEAMKHAFADRAEWLADPAFVAVPIEQLCDPAYHARLANRIEPDCTHEPFQYGSIVTADQPLPLDGGTSHFSIIDADGMAVACTETINLSFGSLVVVPEFGFALNNEMDDFTTQPGEPNAFGLRQSIRNLPEPGKRPLSSMSPTIVMRDGQVVLVAGGSGGPRIITATTQCILNCLLFDMTPQEAVAAPRFHHQWLPNVLQFEESWNDRAAIEAMSERGHATGSLSGEAAVQVIRVTDDGIRAASDPRKGGAPAGY